MTADKSFALDYMDITAPIGRPKVRDRYGPWVLHRRNLALSLKDEPGCTRYLINLKRINTSGEMLDLIFQIAGKSWATPDVLHSLIIALDDIFDPQENLCSFGEQKTICEVGAFLRERLKRRETGCK